MTEFIRLCTNFLAAVLKSRAGLQAENLALRHQLCVYHRSVKRPKVKPADRILWSLPAKAWTGWKDALIFVKPDTVIRWQRRHFKEHWRKLSGAGKSGRPPVADEVKELIRTMSSMNPTWGSPRIVGGTGKAWHHGHQIDCGQVSRAHSKAAIPHLARVPQEPCKGDRLHRFHGGALRPIPGLVRVALSIEHRRILHFAVTEHPTAVWAAQQVVEAFPRDTSPKYLLRDRDKVYGDWFRRRVKNMGIKKVLTAPYSPWQNPYSERLNGSVRRECLHHVIVLSENHLGRVLADYVAYYNESRTHLSLEMDSPITRPVQVPNQGKVVSLPQVGGLHHRYERRAA